MRTRDDGLNDSATRSPPGSDDAAATNLGDPSATTSSHSAVSSTVRVTHPAALSPCQCSGSGRSGTRPRWGFSPNRPFTDAGMRIDPPPSDAYAAPTSPAATAAPDPPDEPPADRPRSHGLRVWPHAIDS